MLRVKTIGAASLALLSLMVPCLSGAATYSNGTGTNTFVVSVQIIANCSIVANPLSFGTTQGVLTAAVSANTTLNVTCTTNTPYNVGLSAGTGAGSTGTTRYLSGTGANVSTVQFNLFQTAGATVWGAVQGTNTQAGTGSGSAQTLTVYGQIPAQSTPQPDTYSSTITATVFF